MALDFPLPYGPIYPVQKDVEPRVNVTTFGDGYKERSGDGINIIPPTTDVVWQGLTEDEATLVDNFLTDRAAQEGFMWTFPGDGTALKWIATKWSKVTLGPGNWGINAHFERDFNPG